MRAIAFLALLLGAALAIPMPAAATDLALASFPPVGQLDYEVTREGDDIGTQTVEFVRAGDQLTVRTHVDITVTTLGITLFHFIHVAEEQWQGGRLMRLTSQTDDDGRPRKVDLRLDGNRLRGTYNGQAVDYAADLIPASLWHPETVHQTVLLDPIKGRDRQVTIADKGEEPLKVRGQTVMAHHYSMTGQINREIWYGPDGQIVQVRFPAKDGSLITVALR
jgi:uncharacterized protein DUF6134